MEIRPRAVPWSKPRHELLLLALVAATALTTVNLLSTQDVSRLCLTLALPHGHVAADDCLRNNLDRARFGGHLYSDKAPGLSVLAIPGAQIVRLPPQPWVLEGDLRIWGIQMLTNGIAFLFCVFAVGRVSEGLAEGTGPLALVVFGLGTLVAPLSATTFGHVTAGAFAFAAFLLAGRRHPLLAGLAAGAAATVEYQVGLIGLAVAAYVALRGLRPLASYALGALPPLALLGAYDWAAFGSPFHLSYRYIDNTYASEQASGFFGIGIPHAHALWDVFIGNRGLLLTSPIVVAAAAGLVLLARTYLAEALLCAAVCLALLAVNLSYFLPYGGGSPGPRFLAPALPFLALGLGPALKRWPVPTFVLSAISIVATTALTLTWSGSGILPYRHTVWAEIARLPVQRGGARIIDELAKNAVFWEAPTRLYGAALVCACAATAFVLAAADSLPRR